MVDGARKQDITERKFQEKDTCSAETPQQQAVGTKGGDDNKSKSCGLQPQPL